MFNITNRFFNRIYIGGWELISENNKHANCFKMSVLLRTYIGQGTPSNSMPSQLGSPPVEVKTKA